MFQSGILIESFAKNNGISINQCRELSDEILIEWELTGHEHRSVKDVRQHLLNHLRVIISKKNIKHEDKDHRLENLIDDCKQLIAEGFPADAVREFYSYWVQPMTDGNGAMLFESVKAFDTRTRFVSYYKKNYSK